MHTQTGLSCPHWVLLFCLCPADGGSEHIQAKWFVSGSGETALLRAQSAPRRKHYLYPLSRSSLHRNSQYQPSPREWVCRTHVHTHLYITQLQSLSLPLSCSISLSLSHTHTHFVDTNTAARHVDCGIFTLYGCDPSVSLAACVCAIFSSILFSLFSLFEQHPVLTSCLLLACIWSGPNPVLVSVQSLICCSVLVSTGGGSLFSLCLRCPDRNGAGLFIKAGNESCLKTKSKSWKKLGSLQQKASRHLKVQRANGSSSCTLCYFLSVNEVKRGYCDWSLL